MIKRICDRCEVDLGQAWHHVACTSHGDSHDLDMCDDCLNLLGGSIKDFLFAAMDAAQGGRAPRELDRE